jgi:DNA invertase Pin-like site-specific DNA recombinase
LGNVNTIIVWKLDRISRSMQDGINTLIDWLKHDIHIVSVTQQLDFSGAVGQMVAGVLFAVAQMERENLRENTKRGLAAARARGVKLGKPQRLFAKDILPLLQNGLSQAQVADKLHCTRQAIGFVLKRENVDTSKFTVGNHVTVEQMQNVCAKA